MITQVDYSQHGEQGAIQRILGTDTGWAVEVGAVDGLYLSNTKALEDKGWTCLCIEPNPFYYAALSQNRKLVMPYAISSKNAELVPFHCYDRGNGDMSAGSGFGTNPEKMERWGVPPPAATYEVKVPVRTLDYCVAAAGFPRVDFLSVDTEGFDLDVMRGFKLEVWKPRLVVIEDWTTSAAMDQHFTDHGYHLIMRMNVNNFYAPV